MFVSTATTHARLLALTPSSDLVLHVLGALSGAFGSAKQTLCVQPRGWLYRDDVLRIPLYRQFSMIITLRRLLDNDWPIFIWKTIARGESYERTQLGPDLFLFTTLLISRVLQSEVENVRKMMGHLVYPGQVIDNQQQFTELTRFRWVLGRLHDAMEQSRTYVGERRFYAGEAIFVEPLSKNGSRYPALAMPTKSTERHNLSRILEDVLGGLQTSLDSCKKDLNEEIQVAIGAVQVNDAQVTKTQTNITVVLTILAAIYLPVTLVTGIFGMNIAEISRVVENPKAWWVAVVWAVIVVLSVGSGLLIWKFWKTWTARKSRKQELDIETGFESDEGSEYWVERAQSWGRSLKQKARMVGRRKEE